MPSIATKRDSDVVVGQVAEAERQKQVAIVAAQREAEQQKIAAEVEAYKRRIEAEAGAKAQQATADGAAQAVKIRAKAEADAAELQAISITKLAEANREAGLKEAEVLRQKNDAANAKSKEILLQEAVLSLIQSAPALMRELVKPAEKIAETEKEFAKLESGDPKAVVLGAAGSYWKEWENKDGIAVAKKLKKPILVLRGSRDYQVNEADFAAWKSGLEGVPNTAVMSIEKANHLFIEGEGKSMPAEYGVPGHVSVDVITRVAAFVTGAK